MTQNTYLLGRLADHARGLVLSEILPSQRLDEMPDAGRVLMFAQEWQTWDQEKQDKFLHWAEKAGRLFLLLPPFLENVELVQHLSWQLKPLAEKLEPSQQDHSLAALLSTEVKHYLVAKNCLVDDQYNHRWSDYRLNTIFYKHHSSSGVFAATCLPLWSLTCLDNTGVLIEWLDGLFTHAGEHKDEAIPENTEKMVFVDAHYVMLCCAYKQSIVNVDLLINRVMNLGVFQLQIMDLKKAAVDLQNAELMINTRLTDLGMQTLRDSGFQIYADELSRMKG